MSNIPPPPQPTVAQVNQWLSELTARQRLPLRLSVVDNLKQVDAAKKLGITQGQFSTNLRTAWTALNGKARTAHFSTPLDESLIANSLQTMPLTAEEDQILRDAALEGIKTATQGQTPPLPPAPQNRRLFIGVFLGIALTLILTAVVGALRNPFAPMLPPVTGPTQTARVETRDVTVQVPQTVIVPQTVEVQVAKLVTVTQEILVTRPVTVTQMVTVTSSAQPASATPGGLLQSQTATVSASITADVGIPLPFIDNFDDDKRSEWVIKEGDPVIISKRLTTNSRSLQMALGNEGLRDYTIEFDYFPRNYHVLYIYFGDFRYRQGSGTYGCVWELKDNNGWSVKAGDNLSLPCPSIIDQTDVHLKFQVSGNKFKVFANGDLASDITYTGVSTRGPFAITFNSTSGIDNFKLTVP